MRAKGRLTGYQFGRGRRQIGSNSLKEDDLALSIQAQLENLPASMTRAALAMGNSFRDNVSASPHSTVCTWCPLHFGAPTGILVVDCDTYFERASVD